MRPIVDDAPPEMPAVPAWDDMERPAPPPAPPAAPRMGWYIISFGILLPFITLAIELSTRACADLLFDPFPTAGHIVLFIAIGVGNGIVLWGARRHRQQGWLRILNGFVWGIAIWYMLQFLPLIPFAALAVVFAFLYPPLFVFGLCGLSPLLAWIAAIFCRKQLDAGVDMPGTSVRRLWYGMGLAALALLVLVGNAFRAAALFLPEAGVVKLPAWGHDGIGLFAFGVTAVGIMAVLHALQRRQACVE